MRGRSDRARLAPDEHAPVEGGTHDSDGDGRVPGRGRRAIPRPLLIPRYAIPAVVTALILNGVDQMIFHSFGFDPLGYQGYDKAMDVYYLAIAYLSTMRNWTSLPAERWRGSSTSTASSASSRSNSATGAVTAHLPEHLRVLLHCLQDRPPVLEPGAGVDALVVLTAAAIWAFVKLPQEWPVHIAQPTSPTRSQRFPGSSGDRRRTCRARPGLVVAVRPRQPAPDRSWHVAADPLPTEAVTADLADRPTSPQTDRERAAAVTPTPPSPRTRNQMYFQQIDPHIKQ
jgi:hypothetical protein